MPEKPLVYILFDRRTRRYFIGSRRWTLFAEDALEYPTYTSARYKAETLSETEDRFIEVVPTDSHFRKENQ